jgi:hypothetical protein
VSSKKTTVEGSCLCGRISFRITLPSRFCAHCHCANCRRAHGAAFVTWAGFPEDQVEILTGKGELSRYVSETGTIRSFYAQCGSTLFCHGPRWEGELHVAVANLTGEIDRVPTAHVYVDHRAKWWTILDSLPQYGGKSGMEPKS